MTVAPQPDQPLRAGALNVSSTSALQTFILGRRKKRADKSKRPLTENRYSPSLREPARHAIASSKTGIGNEAVAPICGSSRAQP